VLVHENDLIICGSDGVFDNLWEQEIVQLATYVYGLDCSGSREFNLAKTISLKAKSNCLDNHYNSPFEASARRNGYFFKGGKGDDITCLVSKVISV